jgi:hypothetical protein
MNMTLAPVLGRCALVFFDDILVFSSSYADHLEHLHEVLTLLARDHWVVKLKKCRFAQQEIRYLGHILSSTGVQTDSDKISTVQQWPVPSNTRELHGFLGLAGFYRKFARHFAIMAKPLTQLLKKINCLFGLRIIRRLLKHCNKPCVLHQCWLFLTSPKCLPSKQTHVNMGLGLFYYKMVILLLMLASLSDPRHRDCPYTKRNI